MTSPHHLSALRQTVEASYEAAAVELRRLARLGPDAISNEKRMTGVRGEGAPPDAGMTRADRGLEFGISKQRAEQLLRPPLPREPKKRGRPRLRKP